MLGIASTSKQIQRENVSEVLLKKFPEMKEMDRLLQCPICYDFMHTAMMISSCSHTFCSLCIRQHLSYQNKCPSCYSPSVETDLKNNRLVDDLIQQFKSVRSKILDILAEGRDDLKEKDCKETPRSVITTSNAKLSGTTTSSSPRVRRVRATRISDMMSPKSMQQSTHGTNCSTPLTGRQQVPLPSSSPVIDLVSDESDFEDSLSASLSSSDKENNRSFLDKHFGSESSPVKNLNQSKTVSRQSTNIGDSEKSESGTAKTMPEVPGESLTSPSSQVSCPVCGVMVRSQVINIHLDACLNGAERKAALRKSTPKRKPMAKLVYSLMSDKDIRKKLKEVGLSTAGNRKILVKRHHDFVLTYNSECDALKPKSAQEIAKELGKMEGMKNKKLSPMKRLQVDKNSSPATIEKAQKSYAKTHKSHFASLIEETRQRMKRQKEEKNKQKHEKKEKDTVRENKSDEQEADKYNEEPNPDKNLDGDVTTPADGEPVPPSDDAKTQIDSMAAEREPVLSSDDASSQIDSLDRNSDVKFLGPKLDNKVQEINDSTTDVGGFTKLIEMADSERIDEKLDMSVTQESEKETGQETFGILEETKDPVNCFLNEEKLISNNDEDLTISDSDSDEEKDDLLDEINKSIDKFDVEESVESLEGIIGSSLGAECENLWPALSQPVATPTTTTTEDEEPLAVQRVTNKSGISDTASDVSCCSELSAVFSPIKKSKNIELEARRSLRSSSAQASDSERNQSPKKRKREGSIEAPLTRSKRRR